MHKEKAQTPMTPLTEAQARALAYWWGGRYRRRPEDGRHVVALPDFPGEIWTREQARRVEHRRPEVNPQAVDWVG
ncbi:MAG: hypothetical protein K6T55_05725 [Syntrophobacterales bacterium]|nr:hypothetical protein [Syntrophobacterales bacterium]